MTQVVTGSPRVKIEFRTSQKNRVRFRDPKTKEYLHLSGTGRTNGVDYAWIGTRAQARAIRDRALSADQPWPFIAERPKGA